MKNMKKWGSWLVVLSLVMALILTGCGNSNTSPTGNNGSNSGDTGKSGEKVVLRFGSHLAEDHSLVVAAKKFADIVSQKSDGRIEVKIFPNNTIGGQRELIEGMQLGTVDMSVNDPGLLSNFAPRIGILDLPYLFKDYNQVRKVLDGEVGKALTDDLLKQGVRSLSWAGTAFRDVLTSKEVKTANDLKGQKLRAPEAPVYFSTIKAMGASPQAIPWGDAYTALQTHVVDGMEGSAESVFTAKMNEVTKYLVRTGHIFTAVSYNISEKTWGKLSQADQKIIQEAATEAGNYAWDLNIQRDKEYRDKLLANGMKEVKIDTSSIVEACKPIQDDYAKKVGAVDLVQKIRDIK
ncbi:MAG: TRAP transporter substrate-binding protein [Desulfitobacteriaceae bacterium]